MNREPYEVPVVVLVRAYGIDRSDATNVAEATVQRALRGVTRANDRLLTTNRVGDEYPADEQTVMLLIRSLARCIANGQVSIEIRQSLY